MAFSSFGSQDNGRNGKPRQADEVQRNAYFLWEKAGRPQGMRTTSESWQDYFWKQAETQAKSSSSSSSSSSRSPALAGSR